MNEAQWPRRQIGPQPAATHDRPSFYKYVSASTAELILEHRTVRWSSPTLFNDPFDVPRQMAFGLSQQDLHEGTREALVDAFRNPCSDYSHFTPVISNMLKMVHSTRDPAFIESIIDDMKHALAAPDSGTLDEMRMTWEAEIPRLRILCLSARNDRTSMWYHYADKYRGAVIELRCDEKLDSPWRIARPVRYEEADIFTARGWGRNSLLKTPLAVRNLVDAYTLHKTVDWSYEDEWRLVSRERPDESANYFDYPFHEEELASVFLGPLMPDTQRAAVLSVLRSKYPRTLTYQTAFGIDRRISFVPLPLAHG